MLYQAQNPQSFITTMGFNPIMFQFILDAGFMNLWGTISICTSTGDGVSHPHRCSLDAAGGLGLVLHYLSSTMLEVSLCEIFALIPALVTQYINFSLPIILKTL
jgi:hypothetical protein